MIHRGKFQNFKALRDVEVTFDSRLTIIVGPNGSGKTSVLQGIRYLCRLIDGESPDEILFGRHTTSRVVSRGVPRKMTLELFAGTPEEWVQLTAVPDQNESEDGAGISWSEE